MSTIWEKRFAQKLDQKVAKFMSSIEDDECLIDCDIAASRAHIRMLRKQGLMTTRDFSRLNKALRKLQKDYRQKKAKLHAAYEDVHMNIEIQMRRCIGKTAENMHMARSRNDLIATDMRLYTRQSAVEILENIISMEQALLGHARAHQQAIIPGYTHLQQAQPILWAYYLLGMFFRMQRDAERLFDAYARVNISPLGACALAGTAHRIDPEFTASILGFKRFADNSMDAVSDRDFMCEVGYCCTQIGLHLASFAEDMVLYTTEEFAHIELDDAIATGSSIMPHKKNPDIFEIIRAQSASLIGKIVALFSVIKGLPSSYNRDLQETKNIFFDIIDTTNHCLGMITHIIPGIHLTRSAWATTPALCCATNLVDQLSAQSHTFREAYDAVAACIRQAQGDVNMFVDQCARQFDIEPESIMELLTPVNAVQAKRSKNSTGPSQVRNALMRGQRIIKQNKRRVKRFRHIASVNF